MPAEVVFSCNDSPWFSRTEKTKCSSGPRLCIVQRVTLVGFIYLVCLLPCQVRVTVGGTRLSGTRLSLLNQQRELTLIQWKPESPAVIVTWRAGKHKLHKLHQRYYFPSYTCDVSQAILPPFVCGSCTAWVLGSVLA